MNNPRHTFCLSFLFPAHLCQRPGWTPGDTFATIQEMLLCLCKSKSTKSLSCLFNTLTEVPLKCCVFSTSFLEKDNSYPKALYKFFTCATHVQKKWPNRLNCWCWWCVNLSVLKIRWNIPSICQLGVFIHQRLSKFIKTKSSEIYDASDNLRQKNRTIVCETTSDCCPHSKKLCNIHITLIAVNTHFKGFCCCSYTTGWRLLWIFIHSESWVLHRRYNMFFSANL